MEDGQSKFEAEQAELEVVLASGIFGRAPSLAQLLIYICRRRFLGEGHLIKEYNIAVEALGRPADFDQKKDSIVRVEAHRLRKRLRQYYETEGAKHELRIDLPPGSYAPIFLNRGEPVLEAGDSAGSFLPAISETIIATPRMVPRWTAALGVVAVVGALALSFWWQKQHQEKRAISVAALAADVAGDGAQAGNLSEIRIAAGSTATTIDADGRPWVSDKYFTGGTIGNSTIPEVEGVLRPQPFRTWRQGQFAYRIPLKPGVYELTLFFCEPFDGFASDNARTFEIRINGSTVVAEMDVYTEAGAPRRLVARTWKDIQPDREGFLTLSFAGRTGDSILSGIKIIPGMPGKLRPIRIAARDEPYVDSEGHLYLTDRYFTGGKLVRRTEAIEGTEDPDLYRGERYGRLTYTVPVPADSTYAATLHFAETWFGRPGPGRDGSRLFDILCNGLILHSNFSVIQEAGGPFRAMRKVFRNLKPTPHGKLVLQLIPSVNYGFINAIEITDEAVSSQKTALKAGNE